MSRVVTSVDDIAAIHWSVARRGAATCYRARPMPAARRPQLARLHAWTGLLLALPLLLLAASGMVLLFKDPLLLPAEWRLDDLPQAEADRELARLLGLPALRDVGSLAPARSGRGFHLVESVDGEPSWWRVGAQAPLPATEVPLRLRLEPWLIEFHDQLLLGEPGDVLVRFVGPLAAMLAIVGLVLWWPLRRGWRWRDLPVRQAGRPQLLRAHLALGAVTGGLVLMHAATGAMLANNPVIREWLAPLVDPRAAAWPVASGGPEFAAGDPVAALATLRRLHPAGPITLASPAGADDSTWTFRLRLPGETHPNGRSNVVADLSTGRVVSQQDARLAGVPGTYDDLLYPLHRGTLFGSWQRWLWLASGVALARLLLLGALAYWRRGRSVARR